MTEKGCPIASVDLQHEQASHQSSMIKLQPIQSAEPSPSVETQAQTGQKEGNIIQHDYLTHSQPVQQLFTVPEERNDNLG